MGSLPHWPRAADTPTRYTPDVADERYVAIRADVVVRLRRVCAHMDRDTFDALVHDVCAFKLRWPDDPDA